MTEWRLQDAKNKFSALVNAALAGEPQRVTRRGQPAVVVLSAEEYDRLCRAESAVRPNFVEHLLAIPKGGPDDLLESLPLEPRDIAW